MLLFAPLDKLSNLLHDLLYSGAGASCLLPDTESEAPVFEGGCVTCSLLAWRQFFDSDGKQDQNPEKKIPEKLGKLGKLGN